MNKRKKTILIIGLVSILIVLILVGLFIEYNDRNTNNKEVKIVASLIEKQNKIEKFVP